MICEHVWKEDAVYSQCAHKVSCKKCALVKVAKPKVYIDHLEVPFAANEYLSFKLIELLISKGLKIDFPKMELCYPGDRIFNRKLWTHGVVLIDFVGNHSRVSSKNIKSLKEILNSKNFTDLGSKFEKIINFSNKSDDVDISEIYPLYPINPIYPDWLYYFDRWVGRIDGNNDSNLLLVDNKIIPVDFNLSFSWNHPIFLKKINDLEVPYHEIIKYNKNDRVRDVIKSLSDKEILDTLLSIGKEFITTQSIIAYYSGLLLRRDLL